MSRFDILRRAVRWLRPQGAFPPDFDAEEIATIRAVEGHTMTSAERLVGLIRALKYLVGGRIEGDIVECGVWKGGSMMAAARTLLRLEDTERHLWLYDTFSGMPDPGIHDRSWTGGAAEIHTRGDAQDRCRADLESVRAAVLDVGYPRERVHFVEGKVEDLLPARMPERIALLRLDTDWYESTKHELEHLFPLLVKGGVLIVDDYGHWLGARRAVDEFLAGREFPLLLNRLDYTGRIAVKI